jgi:hypothetical protein
MSKMQDGSAYSMEAEIKELSAENERLRVEVAYWKGLVLSVRDENKRLRGSWSIGRVLFPKP